MTCPDSHYFLRYTANPTGSRSATRKTYGSKIHTGRPVFGPAHSPRVTVTTSANPTGTRDGPINSGMLGQIYDVFLFGMVIGLNSSLWGAASASGLPST